MLWRTGKQGGDDERGEEAISLLLSEVRGDVLHHVPLGQRLKRGEGVSRADSWESLDKGNSQSKGPEAGGGLAWQNSREYPTLFSLNKRAQYKIQYNQVLPWLTRRGLQLWSTTPLADPCPQSPYVLSWPRYPA